MLKWWNRAFARYWMEERTCSAASLPSGKVSTQSPWTTASDNRQSRYNRAGKGGRRGHACIHTCITCNWSLQICYGIIYGMGAKSLGEQMGVEENDAACYIESFKARYKGTHCCLILLFISPTHCFPDLNNFVNVSGIIYILHRDELVHIVIVLLFFFFSVADIVT